MSLQEIIPNLDANALYEFRIMITQNAGRVITAVMDTAQMTVTAPGASTVAAVNASATKYVKFYYLGSHLTTLAGSNNRVDLRVNVAAGTGFSTSTATISDISINEVTFGANAPIALRNGAAYRYGFQGQERDDEISGSGNSYTAMFWQYDSRLGRRWNLDPKPNPSISQYATFGNNPIYFMDPFGDTVKNKYQEGAKYEGLKAQLKSDIKNAGSKTEKSSARQEFKSNKENFQQYDNFKEVDNLIEGFKKKNPEEFERLDNLKFNGENINLTVGLLSAFSGPSGQTGKTTPIYDNFIHTNNQVDEIYLDPQSIVGNNINIGLYRNGRTVSTLANEFGDAIFSVARAAQVYSQMNDEYLKQSTTIFSFDYEDYIMGGGKKPNPNDY